MFQIKGADLLKILFLLVVLLFPVVISADGAADQNSLYDQLLSRNIRNGLVDYRKLKKEESILDGYLEFLEETNINALSRNEKFAFYINAYNAWTLKLVLSSYPGIRSIKDIKGGYGSPWKIPMVKTNGEVLTLDYIEHRILRPVFKDPRVHFAINCASISCPPLKHEAYRGEELERQLADSAETFINDGRNNYFRGDTLYISRLFSWFREDFGNDPIGFIRKYAHCELKEMIRNSGNRIRIKYLPYDWSLNDYPEPLAQ